MLQKLDNITLNRLRVAERLQNIPEDEFDMNKADCCVAGHTLKEFNANLRYADLEWAQVLGLARSWLGLDAKQASELFTPDSYTGRRYHAKDAARVMRYLAATGEVDWNVGGWKSKFQPDLEYRPRYMLPNLSELTDDEALELV